MRAEQYNLHELHQPITGFKICCERGEEEAAAEELMGLSAHARSKNMRPFCRKQIKVTILVITCAFSDI